MNQAIPSVLIAGAGPAGLVLALTLMQNGIKVRIIDKNSSYRLGQRGSGIMPRTLEIFNLLGVLPDIQNKAADSFPMRSYELPGGTKPLRVWDVITPQSATPAIPYPNPRMIGQDSLEGILRFHLEKNSISVELSSELISFEQHKDGVTANILKTQNGKDVVETFKVNWLVGTDGAKGIVRKHLGLDFLGETREEQRVVLGDMYLKGLDKNYWHMWGESGPISVILRPTENKDSDLFSVFVKGDGINYAKLASDKGELVKFITEFTGRKDLDFGEAVWMSDWRPNIRVVDKFSVGRVFVAGDAAHVHSPTGGQGLNSSVMDVFNLAWKIALVEKGIATPSLLSTYNEERLPVIAEMLDQSTKLLNQTMVPKSTGDLAAWTRGKVLYQLGVNYRGSSAVVEDRVSKDERETQVGNAYMPSSDGLLHAGDRAPQAPELINVQNGDPTSLFQIFKPTRHTVLMFSDNIQQASAILDSLKHGIADMAHTVFVFPQSTLGPSSIIGPVNLVLHDKHGHAYRNYNAGEKEGRVVIVRPDGVVGAIVHEALWVQKYFEGILKA